jgi:predicted pyridoxine 5'-phosphate oxidase superfamily flavin-nucleotide-binding protein
MANRFLETLFSPSVRRAQAHYYGRERAPINAPEIDPLSDDERAFIEARDSFYMATVSENGWPYIQHRGGARGFLRVINPVLLAFADYKGNHQLLSTGNLAVNDRVTLFLMDYPNRTRLKIIGHARIEDAKEHPELFAQLADPDVARVVERFVFIDVVSFDRNCPQYITPRYTLEEIETMIAPLKERIAELESRASSSSQKKARHETNRGAPDFLKCELLQRDFPHQLAAHDIANLQAFFSHLALLIDSAHDFFLDRIELFPPVVERRHVFRFHHQQDFEILFIGGLAEEDLIIQDQVLFFCFVKCALEGLGQTFEVIIGHAGFGLDHRNLPDVPFRVRRITLRRAKTRPSRKQRGTSRQKEIFFHFSIFFLWVLTGSG